MLAGLIAPRIRLGLVLASISCEHCRSSRNNPHCAPRHVIYYCSTLLKKYHDEIGHFGAEKTTKAILSNYWFPNIVEKVKVYVANCLKCIAFSASTGKGEGRLNPIPKDETPFSTYHVDHLGPMDKKITTKQHILVVIDAFTKIFKIYPVKTTDTEETVNCLVEHFRNYSRPRTIISDRGTCFKSHDSEEFVNENKINTYQLRQHGLRRTDKWNGLIA